MASSQTKNSVIIVGTVLAVLGVGLAQTQWVQTLAIEVELKLFDPAAPNPYPVAALPAGTPRLNVLFIGDSANFSNDLPQMLQAIAASDTAAPVDIDVGLSASDSAMLVDNWNNPAARAQLAYRNWNIVVLQEESLMTTRVDLIAESQTGFLEWTRAVTAAGARPLIFEPWARAPGSADYGGAVAATDNLTNAASMQAHIDATLAGIDSTIGAQLVPVGDVWMACENEGGIPSLYAADGAHPSLAGTYLTALLFYRVLTGHALNNVTFMPAGLAPSDAAALAQCAATPAAGSP